MSRLFLNGMPLSDRNPLQRWLPALAEGVRMNRQPMNKDESLRQTEAAISRMFAANLASFATCAISSSRYSSSGSSTT